MISCLRGSKQGFSRRLYKDIYYRSSLTNNSVISTLERRALFSNVFQSDYLLITDLRKRNGFANEINAGGPGREGSTGRISETSTLLLLFLEILLVNDCRYLYNSQNPFH